MKEKWTEVDKRVLNEAEALVENPDMTVRKLAIVFGVSKSTVHNDLTKKLPMLYSSLQFDVNHVLQRNKRQRHLRGGEATKRKYSKR